MIVAENLSKFYSGHRAINSVSFQIQEGEIVGLLGLNGAGKSTILKILGCFLMPSGGTAKVAGHSVDDNPQEIRKLIGYLPDTPPLYDEMAVDSYLHYVAKLKNVAPNLVHERVRAVMDKTNLHDVRHVRLGELSHGFRQRVGIAQALVHDPRVLILDEPINGLDPVQIVEMRDLIKSLRGKYTVVLSSHILSEITRTCDRILIVDRGELVAEGSEAELQRGMTKSMRLVCEVERLPSGLVDSMRQISGITDIKVQAAADGAAPRVTIAADGDVRAQIAQALVNSGAGLLGMQRAEAGLEGLFMKLISGSKSVGVH